MAFVNELISEEDKQKIDWSKFKTWSYSKPHRPWKWTIDRERNTFFIPLDQPGYDDTNTRPEIFALYWKNEIIRVEARVSGTGVEKSWDTLTWTVDRIIVPENLQSEQDEIIHILKEALSVYGWLFGIEPVKAVYVEFV